MEQKERSGHVITDRLAAQVPGRYLKQAVENGYDNGREMYTMSVAEVLEQVDAVMAEAQHSTLLPELPVIPGESGSSGVSRMRASLLTMTTGIGHYS